MNVNVLTKIAEWLEAGAPHVSLNSADIVGFDMTHFGHAGPCGTTCCIAGAAMLFVDGDTQDMCATNANYARGAAILGLQQNVADELFNAEDTGIYLEKITSDWAARCIRKLISCGEVDWDGTREGVNA